MADIGRSNGMPSDEVARLDICMNEALGNLLAHGKLPTTGWNVDIRLEFERQGAANTATLTVIDDCKPFNPLAHVTKPPPLRIEDAEPGGLGIAMMRIYADEIAYQSFEAHNELAFTVRWLDSKQTS